MEGVNNAFCMSKEEYELARLATKCAGLQGKIDDQAAEIAELREMAENIGNLHSVTLDEYSKLKALCDRLGNALEIAAAAFWKLDNADIHAQEAEATLEAWSATK